MKILKVLGIIILAVIIIILVGSLFLPKTYSVNRSTVIKASDSTIYQNVSNFNEFVKWNPWSKMEPSAKITISGPVAQPNHLYQWNGDKTGSGQMEIKSVTPNQMVNIELKFIKPFESLADTRFDIIPQGDSTKVVWTMSGESKGLKKWMGLMMDKMIGKDFEDGLKYLKEKSEQQ